MRLWDREPVMFMSVIQAGISLAVAFGTKLTAEQIGALLAFSAALIGFLMRSQVTPTARMEEIQRMVNRETPHEPPPYPPAA